MPIRRPAPLEPAVDRAAASSASRRVSSLTRSGPSSLPVELLPFRHAFVALDPDTTTEASLFAAYEACLSSVSRGARPDSYFTIVRPRWLMIVPRAEGHIVVDGERTDVGAGAMLGHVHVSSEACADAIERAGSDAIWRLIGETGLPR